MPKRADFRAKASLAGVDDLNIPWKRALKRAEKQAGRSFGKIERLGMRASRGMRRGFRAAGSAVQGAGRAAGMAKRGFGALAKTGGLLAAGFGMAVDRAGKFELEVARLGNLLDNSIDPVSEYSDLLKDMAIRYGTDPIETAQAAYMAFSGGVDTTKSALQEFLPVALKAAKAGFAEPAVAVDALTSILNTFADTGITAAEAANKLFVTEALGKTDFAKISSEIGQVAGFAKEMGVSFDEVLSTMATLTKVGLSTGAAFTQVSSIVAGIVQPTAKAEKRMKKLLGKEFVGAGAIKEVGSLVKWIERVKEVAAEKGPGIITEIFGRKEAIKGTVRLAGSGFEDLLTITAKMGDSAGTLDNKFANVQKRMGFRIQQMKTGFSLLIGELGGGIAEGLGLGDLDDIPERVAKAGKGIRSGAKGFAEGFVKALDPANELATMDWQQFAVSAGRSFGEVTSAIGSLATAAADLINTAVDVKDAWDDARKGVDRSQQAAKKVGTRTIERVTIQKQIEELDARAMYGDFAAGRAAQKLEEGLAQTVMEAWSVGHLRSNTLKDQGIGVHAAGQARQRKIARTGIAETGGAGLSAGLGIMGAAIPPEILAEVIRKSMAFDPRSRSGVMGAGKPVDIGGEVKITIEDKTGASKEVSVEATSKNPKVPVRPAVGKRKTGTG